MAKTQVSFGRRYSPDPEDRGYLMRRQMGAPGTPLPSRRTWRINSESLDQGNTGTCVGQAWRNFLRCAPIRTDKRAPTAYDIYRMAVQTDEWSSNDDEANLPDRDPGLDDGTSVRAGAEAVTKTGRLKSFLWAFNLQSAVEWVLTEGPVVLGLNWYDSMSRPNAAGIATISPQAASIGGHAFLMRGVNNTTRLALCTNSWGDDWGKSGEFYLPFADLERLIHEQGEACSAIEQKLTSKTVKPMPAKAAR